MTVGEQTATTPGVESPAPHPEAITIAQQPYEPGALKALARRLEGGE